MLSLLRNRLGIPGIIAVIALVFAMIGGAWAAGGLTKQQEKQVTKIAKKYAGKQGPQGPAGANGKDGANGLPGPQGSAGPQGPAGPTGATGSQGTKGATGATGATGPTGAPWPVDNVLPSGATLTGAWSFGAFSQEGITNSPLSPYHIPISFLIKLPSDLGTESVHWLKAGEAGDENCPGSAADPKAKAGHLCVYTTAETERWNGELPLANWAPLGPGIYKAAVKSSTGASTAGATLDIVIFGENEEAIGTWAVTAP